MLGQSKIVLFCFMAAMTLHASVVSGAVIPVANCHVAVLNCTQGLPSLNNVLSVVNANNINNICDLFHKALKCVVDVGCAENAHWVSLDDMLGNFVCGGHKNQFLSGLNCLNSPAYEAQEPLCVDLYKVPVVEQVSEIACNVLNGVSLCVELGVLSACQNFVLGQYLANLTLVAKAPAYKNQHPNAVCSLLSNPPLPACVQTAAFAADFKQCSGVLFQALYNSDGTIIATPGTTCAQFIDIIKCALTAALNVACNLEQYLAFAKDFFATVAVGLNGAGGITNCILPALPTGLSLPAGLGGGLPVRK